MNSSGIGRTVAHATSVGRRVLPPCVLPANLGNGYKRRASFFPRMEHPHGRLGRFSSKLAVKSSMDGSMSSSFVDDVEVKVDSVKMYPSVNVVMLRIVGTEMILPVYIGEAESNAITRELNMAKQLRPLTHDLAKSLLQALGFRVTRIRITELVSATFFSRVYVGRAGNGEDVEHEIDVDARPSDAINLALRFGAPMFLSKKVAEKVTRSAADLATQEQVTQSDSDVITSVRSTLSNFEDPTVMFELHKSLAIQQQRFEDAQAFQQQIYYELTHNQLLRLVVAMEAALADGRYEEARRLQDEFKHLQQMVSLDSKEKKRKVV